VGRSEERAKQVREFGIQPILGSLSDKETLTNAARDADAAFGRNERSSKAAMVDAVVDLPHFELAN
jgi:hypothetical protein